MDYQEALHQLFAGSENHRKRKLELDKQKQLALKASDTQKIDDLVRAQLRWIARIREGNNNTLRTLRVRMFVLGFVQKRLVADLQKTETLLKEFNAWLETYITDVIKKSLIEEKKSMQTLALLLKKCSQLILLYQRQIKKETDIRWKSCYAQGILMLQLVVVLFKKVKPLLYDPEIFSDENRYSPLNVFFPFKASF